MVAKRDAQRWLITVLGKKDANAILKKMERMAKKEVPLTKIETVIAADIMTHIKTGVVKTVIAKAYPRHWLPVMRGRVGLGTGAKGTK